MPFQSYRLQNTCLCKCLKSHVSVHPRKVNVLNVPTRCCNLHDSSLSPLFVTLGKYDWKKSFIVISEILRSFVNTLGPDE